VISDHVFRGGRTCLYFVPGQYPGSENRLCGRPESAHKESVGVAASPPRNWLLKLRSFISGGLGWNRPAHYLAPKGEGGRAQVGPSN
jgi:hypothetical protein